MPKCEDCFWFRLVARSMKKGFCDERFVWVSPDANACEHFIRRDPKHTCYTCKHFKRADHYGGVCKKLKIIIIGDWPACECWEPPEG